MADHLYSGIEPAQKRQMLGLWLICHHCIFIGTGPVFVASIKPLRQITGKRGKHELSRYGIAFTIPVPSLWRIVIRVINNLMHFRVQFMEVMVKERLMMTLRLILETRLTGYPILSIEQCHLMTISFIKPSLLAFERKQRRSDFWETRNFHPVKNSEF